MQPEDAEEDGDSAEAMQDPFEPIDVDESSDDFAYEVEHKEPAVKGLPFLPFIVEPFLTTPPAPARGKKRKMALTSTAASSSARTTKQPKKSAKAVRVRPKKADFVPLLQVLIGIACKHTRCLVSIEEAFPDAPLEDEFITLSWGVAYSDRHVDVPLDDAASKVVSA